MCVGQNGFAELIHGGLFEGIGGFPYAANELGIETKWSNEIDTWCCKVLTKNFKHKILQDDIRKFGKQNLEPVDIVSGGFPCQPFSIAGKRKSENDDHFLWPEMLRIITEIKPAYVIGENVTGIIGLALDKVLFDLEAQGYTTETFIIPACGKNAWHKRDRVWIVAYPSSYDGWYLRRQATTKWYRKSKINEFGKNSSFITNTNGTSTEDKIQTRRNLLNSEIITYSNSERGCCRKTGEQDAKNVRESSRNSFSGNWDFEPGICGVVDGLPGRVDRLKGLGNAIVPQIAYEIFKAIQIADRQMREGDFKNFGQVTTKLHTR